MVGVKLGNRFDFFGKRVLIIFGEYRAFFNGGDVRVRNHPAINQEIAKVKTVVIGKLQNLATEFGIFTDLYAEVALEIKVG